MLQTKLDNVRMQCKYQATTGFLIAVCEAGSTRTPPSNELLYGEGVSLSQ